MVTGGGGGIGGATSRRFAAEGAKVAVFDLNLDTARKVAANIAAAGGVAEAFACDIANRAAVDAAVAAVEARLGPIDVLVNNAGWDIFRPFVKTEPAQWEKLIAINMLLFLPLGFPIAVAVDLGQDRQTARNSLSQYIVVSTGDSGQDRNSQQIVLPALSMCQYVA